MTRIRLILMPAEADAPCPWLVIGEGGAVLERGQLSPEHPTYGPVARTVLVAPGSDVLVRWLDLPAQRPAQARAAAAWMLRDEVATPVDQLQITVADSVEGEASLVAAVAVERLQGWLDRARALGVEPDVIMPDCLAVTEPADDAVAAVRFGPMLALRGARLAVTCDADLAPLLAEGRPIIPVEDPDAIEAMLIGAALNPPLNLLGRVRNDGADGWRAWRRTAGLAAAVLVSPLVLMAAEAVRDDLAAQALQRRSGEIVSAAWPDTPPGADPAAEVRRRGASVGLSGKAQALFAALAPLEGAELDAMTLGRDGALRAVVSHPDYADLQALAAALADVGLSLREDSSEEREGRIVSDVVIEGAA